MNPVTIEVKLSGAYENTYTDVCVLTSVEDLIEYQSVQDERVRRDFRKYIQSSQPDHEKYGAEVSSLFVLALNAETAVDILSGLDGIIRESALAKLDKIQNGQHVVVNKNGGWFPIDPHAYSISERDPYHFMRHVSFVPGTQVIALENDERLDPFFDTFGTPVSSVVNLRDFSEDDLLHVFDEFDRLGGNKLLVYTQANQLDEVAVYLRAYERSSLTDLTIILAVPKSDRPDAVKLYEEYDALVLDESQLSAYM